MCCCDVLAVFGFVCIYNVIKLVDNNGNCFFNIQKYTHLHVWTMVLKPLLQHDDMIHWKRFETYLSEIKATKPFHIHKKSLPKSRVDCSARTIACAYEPLSNILEPRAPKRWARHKHTQRQVNCAWNNTRTYGTSQNRAVRGTSFLSLKWKCPPILHTFLHIIVVVCSNSPGNE